MLSETEMKEFFQRVVDEVAQLSTQASRVEGLEAQLRGLYERVDALEQANANLTRELGEAHSTIVRMETEIVSATSRYEAERNAVSALRETLIQRDTRVQELESNLSTERDAHKITLAERDDARTKVGELEQSLAGVNETLSQVTTSRNDWQSKCSELEKETADLRQRLDRVQAILNPIRAVPSADVA
jgi:chromosome segregation ATPase